MTTYYKVLNEKGAAHHGGRGSWPLPRGKRPGKWLEVEGAVVPCANGLHLCHKLDLIHWIGPTIWIAEADESHLVVDSQKVVVHRARLLTQLDTWNETTARLFAADCAKDAVRRTRKAGIEVDARVDECVRVVYRFARGEATEAERSAAASAASAAASAASDSASASAASAARSAAWDSAAWSAGSAAASAAWSAASAAASAASESAASAARSAARSAVESWQTKRLFEYLEGKRS